MHVKFLGCGDAFGSGGRLNTCFLVTRESASFLIDCGASAMISIRRFGVDPNGIAAIVLSHLHADHFGGLPAFILDAQLVSRRTRPLLIAGPNGLATRLDALMEAHFPGSTSVERKFPDGRTLSYTGDTEWVDALLPACRDADLLIAEAYCFERKVRFHLDYATLREKLPMIGAKRIILTHMSPDMLGRVGELQDCEAAYDGLELEIV